MINTNNANDGFGDLVTIPCLASCCLATVGLALITRTSYTLGANIGDRGDQTYQRAFWTLCIALISVSGAFVVTKIFE